MSFLNLSIYSIIFSLFSFQSLQAAPFSTENFICTSNSGYISDSEKLTVQAELLFKEVQIDGYYTLHNTVGFIKVSTLHENKPLSLDSDFYYGAFGPEKIEASPNYEKGNSDNNVRQYKNFNAVAGNGYDGGLISGVFFLEKLSDGRSISKARYSFKAGTRLSGIIEFNCKIK